MPYLNLMLVDAERKPTPIRGGLLALIQHGTWSKSNLGLSHLPLTKAIEEALKEDAAWLSLTLSQAHSLNLLFRMSGTTVEVDDANPKDRAAENDYRRTRRIIENAFIGPKDNQLIDKKLIDPTPKGPIPKEQGVFGWAFTHNPRAHAHRERTAEELEALKPECPSKELIKSLVRENRVAFIDVWGNFLSPTGWRKTPWYFLGLENARAVLKMADGFHRPDGRKNPYYRRSAWSVKRPRRPNEPEPEKHPQEDAEAKWLASITIAFKKKSMVPADWDCVLPPGEDFPEAFPTEFQ